MADNVTALTITANATLGWKPLIATPSAVPEAGGCSVFVMIIKNIESPTAMEYIMTFMDGGCGISVLTDPHRRPIICPPITFLGLAVTLLGIAKTIKLVAPIDATITARSMLRNTSTIDIARVARKL